MTAARTVNRDRNMPSHIRGTSVPRDRLAPVVAAGHAAVMTVRWMSFAALLAVLTGVTTAQNSTRKIRKPPGEQAARAGQGVQWREDLEAAMAESKQGGKPVFWYVPSVRRSPMDRKPVIDRYMMGGPFSWPAAIVLLNQHFVPVREVARRLSVCGVAGDVAPVEARLACANRSWWPAPRRPGGKGKGKGKTKCGPGCGIEGECDPSVCGPKCCQYWERQHKRRRAKGR